MFTLLSKPQLQWKIYDAEDKQIHVEVMNIIPEGPTDFWPQGVFVNTTYELRVPTDIQPGKYILELKVMDASKQQYYNHFEKSFEIVGRERIYDLTDPTNIIRAIFGEKIEIVGYELDSDTDSLNLVLVWRAVGKITKDYKYFVHISEQEQVVAQVDSMPQKWTYPTSWWAPGEVIVDELTFDISNIQTDDYEITLGFYDPTDGERLRVYLSDGNSYEQDWVTLQEHTYE